MMVISDGLLSHSWSASLACRSEILESEHKELVQCLNRIRAIVGNVPGLDNIDLFVKYDCCKLHHHVCACADRSKSVGSS
jgi:hypothetical protein